MPKPPTPPILDDRLARLGSEWFAEVRRKNSDDPPRTRKTGEGGAGEAGGGLLEALFGDGDGDGGDGGD